MPSQIRLFTFGDSFAVSVVGQTSYTLWALSTEPSDERSSLSMLHLDPVFPLLRVLSSAVHIPLIQNPNGRSDPRPPFPLDTTGRQ